ncbi:MAG: DNA recombination protein RmuC [Parvularculaceae bacterium]
MAETTTAVLTPAAGVSPGLLIALLVLSALLLTALTAFTAWRAERARARALAELARQTERARAGEIAAGEAAILRGEREGLALTLERERAEARGLERQIADLKEAKEQMRQAFAENAGALMQSHSESFKSQNKEQIEHLLAPLKEDIVRFKRTLGEAHEKSVEQHGSLKEQIALLARHSDESSRKTAALTRALKGDVQLQGAWGEMKVETILKRLGFQEGVEYTRQETFSDGDARARTDFVINLPQGERLIIDAKVSLVDFEAHVNAEDDAARAASLAAHARSLRAHAKGLAAKNYPKRVGTRLDFVILFVPIEAALGAALKHDEALCLEALDNHVAFATPATLTTQLKTVAAMWRIERQQRNAEEIANRAGALYDKFCGFAGDLSVVGERLRQLDGAYQSAMSKLSTGNGNLVRQAEMLKQMGASTSKALPRELLSAAGADEPDDLLSMGEPLAAPESEPRRLAVQ